MAERYIPPAVVKGQGTPKREFGQKGQDEHSEVLPEAVLGPGARRLGRPSTGSHGEPSCGVRGPRGVSRRVTESYTEALDVTAAI